MIAELSLDYGRIRVVSFVSLYVERIERILLQDIRKYSCTPRILDKTAERLVAHHILHGLCEYILSQESDTKIVILYCSQEFIDTSSYDAYSDIGEYITTLSKVIKAKLPIRWYTSSITLHHLQSCLRLNKDVGMKTLYDIKSLCNTDYTSFLFRGIRQYTKKHGLKFLNEQYFCNLRAKMLIVT